MSDGDMLDRAIRVCEQTVDDLRNHPAASHGLRGRIADQIKGAELCVYRLGQYRALLERQQEIAGARPREEP